MIRWSNGEHARLVWVRLVVGWSPGRVTPKTINLAMLLLPKTRNSKEKGHAKIAFGSELWYCVLVERHVYPRTAISEYVDCVQVERHVYIWTAISELGDCVQVERHVYIWTATSMS